MGHILIYFLILIVMAGYGSAGSRIFKAALRSDEPFWLLWIWYWRVHLFNHKGLAEIIFESSILFSDQYINIVILIIKFVMQLKFYAALFWTLKQIRQFNLACGDLIWQVVDRILILLPQYSIWVEVMDIFWLQMILWSLFFVKAWSLCRSAVLFDSLFLSQSFTIDLLWG